MNSPAPLDVKSASERVLGWQTRLHRWAVGDEQARFGDLFNLICDPATLFVAWERVKRNRGSKTAGVDGITRKHIEELGVEEVLSELRQSLPDRTYVPLPVREHQIPKRGSGKVRKLGIPALRDRIVQMATELVLEPIFGKRRTTGMREGNERVLHRRLSESRWLRVSVGDPRGRSEAFTGVHADRLLSLEMVLTLGCRRGRRRRKAIPRAAFSRAVSGPRGV